MNKRQRNKRLKKLDEYFLRETRKYKAEKRTLVTWSKSWIGILQKSEISKAKDKQIRKDKVWINEWPDIEVAYTDALNKVADIKQGHVNIPDGYIKPEDIKPGTHRKWFFHDSKDNDPALKHFIHIEEELQKNITQSFIKAIQSVPEEDKPCRLRFMVKDGIGNIISETILHIA